MGWSLQQLPRLEDCALEGKRVVVRSDMNVPLLEGKISNARRIHESLPTLQYILQQGGSVIALSHLGRPCEGVFEECFSLAPVANVLSQELQRPVRLVQHYLNGIEMAQQEVVLCENVRFNEGEKTNDAKLSQQLAALGDCFVMDAFGAAHRAHASTCGALEYAPCVAGGLLLIKELEAVEQFNESARKPRGAILGGAKISDKLGVLHALMKRVDWIVPAGGIANTLLAAQGYSIGKSLYEENMLEQAAQVLHTAQQQGIDILCPEYVVCATSPQGTPYEKQVSEVGKDEMILDLAPQSIAPICQKIAEAGTILWNGPPGLFERKAFSKGTQAVAQAIARSDAYSIAGGGDTLACIDQFGVNQQISYISTGGGALLELLEGRCLPALQALAARSRHKKNSREKTQ